MQRYIVGISGASGMPLAKVLLQTLYQCPNIEVHLIISEGAQKVLQTEPPSLNCEHNIKPQLSNLTDVKIHKSQDVQTNYSSDLHASVLAGLQTSDLAGSQTSDLTGTQTNYSSDLHASVLAGLHASGLSDMRTSDLSGLQKRGLVGLQSNDLAGLQKSDLAGLQANDLAGLQKSDLAGLQANNLSDLQKSDSSNLQGSNLTGLQIDNLSSLTQYAHVVHDILDIAAGPASGSWKHSGMIICPCSMSSLASIASGAGQNLLHRAADVCIKESRPLILAPRETPLSTIHLQNMLTLSKIGVKIMPPCPAFYGKIYTLESIIEHFIARILDQLKIEHNLGFHWKEQ